MNDLNLAYLTMRVPMEEDFTSSEGAGRYHEPEQTSGKLRPQSLATASSSSSNSNSNNRHLHILYLLGLMFVISLMFLHINGEKDSGNLLKVIQESVQKLNAIEKKLSSSSGQQAQSLEENAKKFKSIA